MGKILIIIGIIYFLYYAGMIIYDLFIKKEVVVNPDETQVFSIGDYAEENKEEMKAVGIEDVENINTPKSFTKKEKPKDDKTDEESPDIDELRKKFEAEENIDFEISNEEEIQKEETIESKLPNRKDDKKTNFHELLNLAETQVQVVASQDGRKIYQVDK